MLTWIVYVLVITLILSGAALAAEYGARLRHNGRSRWIWALTLVASLIVPTFVASVSIRVPSLLAPTVHRKATPLSELTTIKVVPLTWVHEHTRNIAALNNENRTLQRAWVVVSVALFAALIANGAYLFWRKRRWERGTVAGVSVYIAPDVGPAVVGLMRPRIVVPAWLTEASHSHQTMVIAHEQGHLAGYDPQLLTVALCLVVLMPWNLPLWWQLHRLRYAIEVDCDARVLKSGLDTRQYGEMLIDVSQRRSVYIGAVAAMSESRSFLEDRIAIMVRDPAKWGSLATVVFGSLALALVAVAAQVTPPNFGSPDGPIILTPDVLDQYVGFYLRGANAIYTVTRDGEHLMLQADTYPPAEIAADTDMNFTFTGWSGGPRLTFVHGASGETTGLIEHDYILEVSFSIPMPRIDASTAQAIKANNEARAQSQTPSSGSDVALRHLIDGILAAKPNYDEMTPWYAKLVRDASSVTRAIYAKRGAVRSIEFRHVDQNGGDVYEVRQERGVSSWTIFLDSKGLIADASDSPGSG
jgi:beta-lactamase regulating signal transducer with metallopeptidase domain